MAATTSPFTAQELDVPIATARAGGGPFWSRVLHHVAGQHGVSTAGANRLIDRAMHELGVVAPLDHTTTLGTVLAHMNQDTFKRTPEASGAALDAPVTAAFDDNKLVDRIVRSLSLDQGIAFDVAMLQLLDASDEAREYGQGSSLRATLERTKSAPEDIDVNVRLFAQRDEAVLRVLEEETAHLRTLHAHPSSGLILLDQGPDAPAADVVNIGQALRDDVERENRLARARKYEDAYRLDAGREQFFADDRAHLEAGVDIVRSLEVAAQVHAAEAKAAEVGRQLDETMHRTIDKRSRLRELDAEFARLDGQRASVTVPATVPSEQTMHERVRSRLRQLGAPETEYPRVLLELLSEGEPRA